MPPKTHLRFVCTDRTPLVQGEIRDRPGRCFTKGLKAGLVAGLKKGQEGQVPAGQPPQPPPAPRAPQQIPRRDVVIIPNQADDIYRVIDDFVRGVEQIARPNVRLVFNEAAEEGRRRLETQMMRREDVAVQVAPPMQIPPVPIVPMFQAIEEEPIPAPIAEEPRVRRKGRRKKFREFYGLDKEEEKKEEEPPKKIVLAQIKNLLGKDNYKEFKRLAKADADRRGRKIQDVYDKYGIVELKLLAQVMKDKLDLSADNDAKLTQIIEDRRKQGNKATLKGLMDSVIRSLRTQGRGVGQSKVTVSNATNEIDLLNDMIRMEEERRNLHQALFDTTRDPRHSKAVQDSNRSITSMRARLSRLQNSLRPARTA